MSYTIKLDGGKYIVVNHGDNTEFMLHGAPWPGWDFNIVAPSVKGLVLAMAQRIEELEVAVKSVLDGELIITDVRKDNGMKDFRESAWTLPLRQWETTLRNVLEQKP